MKWKSQSLFYNAAEKSVIIIKFDVDNNTVVILYIKQQKSWHQSNISLVPLWQKPSIYWSIEDKTSVFSK